MQKIVALRHAADGDEIIRRLHEELRRASMWGRAFGDPGSKLLVPMLSLYHDFTHPGARGRNLAAPPCACEKRRCGVRL